MAQVEDDKVVHRMDDLQDPLSSQQSTLVGDLEELDKTIIPQQYYKHNIEHGWENWKDASMKLHFDNN